MRILVLGGMGAIALTLPLTLFIILILAIVVTSYHQTIRAYPMGGGSYMVAKDKLGTGPALIAAASLLTDYILTVSVSVAAGVLALTSIFLAPFEYRVFIDVFSIALLAVGNLRGVRESAAVFSLPTYCHIFLMLGVPAYGVFRYAMGTLPVFTPPPDWATAAPVAIFPLLVFRAFASWSVALTG